MGILEFFGSLFFYVWFTSAIFWAIAASAFASWARLDFKLAIPVGLVFQGAGLIGLGIYYAIKKQSPTQPFGYSAVNTPQANPFAVNDPFGSSNAGAFGSSPFGSSTTAYDPFAGPTNNRRPGLSGWIKTLPGASVVFGSIAVILAFVWSLFLTWFNITTSDRQSGSINAFSTGFEFWVFITIGLIITSVILCIKKPSLISAVLLALSGSWWLMLSTASLTAREIFVPAVDKLFQIPNLVTSTDGYSATWAFDVGAAWYVVFFNSVLLLVASCWMVAVANREVTRA